MCGRRCVALSLSLSGVCPNACNGRGDCSYGYCFCRGGFFGTDCQNSRRTAVHCCCRPANQRLHCPSPHPRCPACPAVRCCCAQCTAPAVCVRTAGARCCRCAVTATATGTALRAAVCAVRATPRARTCSLCPPPCSWLCSATTATAQRVHRPRSTSPRSSCRRWTWTWSCSPASRRAAPATAADAVTAWRPQTGTRRRRAPAARASTAATAASASAPPTATRHRAAATPPPRSARARSTHSARTPGAPASHVRTTAQPTPPHPLRPLPPPLTARALRPSVHPCPLCQLYPRQASVASLRRTRSLSSLRSTWLSSPPPPPPRGERSGSVPSREEAQGSAPPPRSALCHLPIHSEPRHRSPGTICADHGQRHSGSCHSARGWITRKPRCWMALEGARTIRH